METHLDVELAALRRLASASQSAASRIVWHRAMQRRSTRVASLVRMLPRLVPGNTVRRSKVDGAWLVEAKLAEGIANVMGLETRPREHTRDALAASIVVRLHRPDLVDRVLLARLECEGLVRIVMAPS